MEEEAEKKRREAAMQKRKSMKDDGKKALEEFDKWDFMYSALELLSNKRKRC